MSGLPELNFPAFDKAAEELRKVGYEVINPAEVDRALGIDNSDEAQEKAGLAEFNAAMRRDIPLVMRSDGVALLHGWRTSKGANVEVTVAEAIGLKARPVDSWLLIAAMNRTRVVNR
jgi:hypothetical protein